MPVASDGGGDADLEEKDRAEDQDQCGLCVIALHLWLLLATLSFCSKDKSKDRIQNVLRKIGYPIEGLYM